MAACEESLVKVDYLESIGNRELKTQQLSKVRLKLDGRQWPGTLRLLFTDVSGYKNGR